MIFKLLFKKKVNETLFLVINGYVHAVSEDTENKLF